LKNIGVKELKVFSPRKIKKILGTVKASAVSVKISCVSCCDIFLKKMERALSVWPKDDIIDRAVSGAVVREKGSFPSSEWWLEKLEEWMSMHTMNMIELPSADCEAK